MATNIGSDEIEMGQSLTVEIEICFRSACFFNVELITPVFSSGAREQVL